MRQTILRTLVAENNYADLVPMQESLAEYTVKYSLYDMILCESTSIRKVHQHATFT